MLTKHKIRRWEAAVRQQAYHDARALAVAAGTAWAPPPYHLGIVLEPGEIVWHRYPATYRWRGADSWLEQQSVRRGRVFVTRKVTEPVMFSLGKTDWLVTSLRLAARAQDGQVISIYWIAIGGLILDMVAEVVILDGPGGYHGELSGLAIAPITVAIVATLFGSNALLLHPSLAPLRWDRPAGTNAPPQYSRIP